MKKSIKVLIIFLSIAIILGGAGLGVYLLVFADKYMVNANVTIMAKDVNVDFWATAVYGKETKKIEKNTITETDDKGQIDKTLSSEDYESGDVKYTYSLVNNSLKPLKIEIAIGDKSDKTSAIQSSVMVDGETTEPTDNIYTITAGQELRLYIDGTKSDGNKRLNASIQLFLSSSTQEGKIRAFVDGVATEVDMTSTKTVAEYLTDNNLQPQYYSGWFYDNAMTKVVDQAMLDRHITNSAKLDIYCMTATMDKYEMYIAPGDNVYYAKSTAHTTGVVVLPTMYKNLAVKGVYVECRNNQYNSSFAGTAVTKVVLATTTDKILDNTFNGCQNLMSINISNTVTEIGDYAFYNCKALESIYIPASIETIGQYTYSSCYGANNIVVNKFNEKFDSRDNCKAIINSANNTMLYGFNVSTIPSGVVEIGSHAFYYMTGLTEIVLPEGLVKIREQAFDRCSGLTQIILPNSVKEIGNRAFRECDNVTSINLGKVVAIGAEVFSHTAVTEVTIPDTVTDLGSYAFSYCDKLTTINFAKGLNVHSNAFEGCNNLNKVNISSITEWAKMNFDNDTTNPVGGTTKLYVAGAQLPSEIVITGVEKIGKNIFAGMDDLIKVTIEGDVKEYEMGVFSNCVNLQEVVIKPTIGVGNKMFKGCTALNSVTIPEGVKIVEVGAFDGCSSLKTIELPSTIEYIAGEVFRGCSSLTEIDLGEKLTYMGSGAFENCTNLQSIILPKSLKEMGNTAFKNCTSLRKVLLQSVVKASSESPTQSVFYGCSTDMICYYNRGENGDKIVEFRDATLYNNQYFFPYVSKTAKIKWALVNSVEEYLAK